MELVVKANKKDGSALLYFEGKDTFESKEKIKGLGHEFGEIEIDCVVATVKDKVWHKVIPDAKKNMKAVFDELVKTQEVFGDIKVSMFGREMTLDKIIEVAPFKK